MAISITPLGAGQDVGRSCILTKIGSKTIMFDCGMHMGFRDERRYPDFKLISATLDPFIINASIDLVVVSHYHLDHCGALPFFTEKIGYSGPIIMTYPTKSVSSVLLADSCKIMEQRMLFQKASSDLASATSDTTSNTEYGYFTISDVWSCLEKVKAIQLHQTVNISGIRVTPYYAGHVLGASMFYIQVDDESIVYTGDFNMVRDRHLGPAQIPRLKPNLLISESTYATYIRPSRRSTERTFCEIVHDFLKKGGKVLIPVFAIGRAQELCILLEIYWRRMQLRFPIFFGGAMTEKANSYYQMFTNWTNTSLADNVFRFPHVLPYDKSILTRPGPAVLFATPGMLHTGLSLHAFKMWAPDPNNLTIVPGFCVTGTVGSKIINGAKRVFLDQKDPSACIEVRCHVKYLSFSSHADSLGIKSLIFHAEPLSVAFVHGEKNGMLSLASFMNHQYKIPSFCPHNGSVTILPTYSKLTYSCHLSIRFLLRYALKSSNLVYKNFKLRNMISKFNERINNSLTYSIESVGQSISRIRSLIYEYYSLKLISIYVFTSKHINRYYPFIFTKNELFMYISRKSRVAQKKIMQIHFQSLTNKTKCEKSRKGYQYENFQIKNSFNINHFNLIFYSEIYNTEISKLLTAIENLKEKIISKQLENEKLIKFNGFRVKDKKPLKIYFCDDSTTISYRSLVVNITTEKFQVELFKQFFNKSIDYNSLEKKIIDKMLISWSFIDNQTNEISEFINNLEKK